ncbi:hypothetical protein MN116_007983 [Schistosoma mekongi]|uniref:Uncharacterized protein n=1 Tax=Schistosoma mekongi TaxID=38744 RepID=A0AAE1Z8R1_SCHME|nr:hypothetical protein MN116_007983 [Schistosoma mekongi]
MPLFKLIIQIINENNKQNENIFRWCIKESIENVTYEHLIKRLQRILCKLRNHSHSHYYHDNDDVINDDLQILWFDGEDMCRIVSTEDLHDAAKTLAGSEANDCSIRIYIKIFNSELIKSNLINEKKEIIELPDLPTTLEKFELDETNQSTEIHQDNDDNIKDPLKQSTMNRSISSDCQYQSNCIMPSAPALPTSPIDALFASFSSTQSNISSIKSYPIYHSSNVYTTYPYNIQLYNQMKLTRLSSPSSPSSSLSPTGLTTGFTGSYQNNASTLQYYCLPQTNMNNALSLRNNMQLSPYNNLTKNSLHNIKPQVNITAIIIQLRHMGFQQTDMYLSSIIQQYNGNFNSILDRLSIDMNKKS